MAAGTIEEQLVSYLTDAHSIEQQAIAQLRAAPDIAGEPLLAAALRDHLAESEEQQRLVGERLEAHGGSPSKLKEAVMGVTGPGFVLFAKSQPDTPGKLATHSLSYEHLELASYELLGRVAGRAGDEQTVAGARRIRDEEAAMAARIEALFDATAEASLAAQEPDDLAEQLTKYLADAHAIEGQAEQLLQRAPKILGAGELAPLYTEHLEETREHKRLVEERLDALGAKPSKLKDAVMRLGALNWGGFFQGHPDTAGKLTAFAYAFEHLEVGAYEHLKRVARRAGDQATVETAERILGEERTAAQKLAGSFSAATDASLRQQGVAG
ncbi:MAG TPA: DUF892 family protein [Solirubrobacteraceae bacterium]|nr:DUF892 family protein [Solirubrobacteraceae bacterium]